jgi:hypothetical protein
LHQPALTVGRESQGSPQIVVGEGGEISEYFFICHSRRHVFENLVNGDSKAAYARLAAALVRFDSDAVL